MTLLLGCQKLTFLQSLIFCWSPTNSVDAFLHLIFCCSPNASADDVLLSHLSLRQEQCESSRSHCRSLALLNSWWLVPWAFTPLLKATKILLLGTSMLVAIRGLMLNWRRWVGDHGAADDVAVSSGDLADSSCSLVYYWEDLHYSSRTMTLVASSSLSFIFIEGPSKRVIGYSRKRNAQTHFFSLISDTIPCI